MKKLLISLLVVLSCPLVMSAQGDARAYMDKVAQKFRTSGGIELDFEATEFVAGSDRGTTSGKLQVKGSKFKMQVDQMTTWYDGKTLWTLLKNEVQKYTPTKGELQARNPYAFVDLYKTGYLLSMEKIEYKEQTCQEVHLLSKSTRSDIQEIYVTFDEDMNPLTVRVRIGKQQWTRIRVSGFKSKLRLDDKIFTFNPANYPGVVVINQD